MDLLLLGVALFVLGTSAVALAGGTGGSRAASCSGVPSMCSRLKIVPGLDLLVGPITTDVPRQAEPKLNNWTFKGVAALVLLLLINGAILAAAILFVIGAFTAGSGWGGVSCPASSSASSQSSRCSSPRRRVSGPARASSSARASGRPTTTWAWRPPSWPSCCTS